jgi:RNA polymerase sigma factor (sigma-70 family)
MAGSQINEVMQHLRRTVLLHDGAELTDGQLLGCFIEHRDDDAFAALVRRHALMVWGVCRRLLNQHDAEDAFQATFLVLVRKATSIVPRERAANWLYGVAYRTALQARRTAARRREREKQVTELPEPAVVEQDLGRDAHASLHQELSRLPDAYREVIVLSDLEGKTRKEIARDLGLAEGTVGSRLARARTMLAGRLARRGAALSLGTLAAVLANDAASASAPPSLLSSTLQAASLFASGQAPHGVISARVVALTEGVHKAMFLTKSKIAAAVVLIVVSLTGGAGLIYQTQAAQDATGREKQGPTAQRAAEPVGEKGDKTAELQHQIGELEKQVQSLTNEVIALQKKVNTPTAQPPAKPEVKTFQLHNRSVDEVAQTLWDLYRNKANSEIRIAKDGPTNTLIVVGSSNDLAVIESIVTQLEKLPKKGKKDDKGEQ